ncbi:sugar/nucleoside kinase (ribokinase family) [Devosia sp. UYZn731]|uniref:PfkB family carbohydrate kinase n=1 Tax=Devosia sp. UYZn731 TaxID=3156345 RepID=UPI003394392C
MTGIDPSDELRAHQAAERLIGFGAKVAILKLGARGVFVLAAGEGKMVPTFPVDASDSIAAGDCFNAGFGVAITRGFPLSQALRHGAAAGALATTKMGGSQSAPTDLERFTLMPTFHIRRFDIVCANGKRITLSAG